VGPARRGDRSTKRTGKSSCCNRLSLRKWYVWLCICVREDLQEAEHLAQVTGHGKATAAWRVTPAE
jgi:hypothetical protein